MITLCWLSHKTSYEIKIDVVCIFIGNVKRDGIAAGSVSF